MVCLFAQFSTAQNRLFNNLYNTSKADVFYGLAVQDSNFYCFGGIVDTQNQRMYFNKVDYFGSILSAKEYFVDSTTYLGIEDPIIHNNKIYGCSYHYPEGYAVPILYVLNLEGDTLATHSYDFGIKVTAYKGFMDSEKNLVFTCNILDTFPPNVDDDLFIMKLDTLGNLLWHKKYGGWENDCGFGVVNTPDSGYLVAGFTTQQPNTNADPYLLKLDINGNLEWERWYPSLGGDNVKISALSNGNYMLYGTYDTTQSLTDDLSRMMEVDENGDIIWEKIYDFSTGVYDGLLDFFELDDGYVFLGDHRISGEQAGNLFKTDFNGNIIWRRQYQPRSTGSLVADIEPLPNGDMVVAGFVMPDANHSQDAWLMRLNCLGYDKLPYANFYFPSDTIFTSDSISVLNLGMHGDEFIWSFGDGNGTYQDSDIEQISLQIGPVGHVYTDTGWFVIEQWAVSCTDTSYHSDSIYVQAKPVVPNPPLEQGFALYPNPTSQQFTLQYYNGDSSSNYQVLLYNSQGKLVFQEEFNSLALANGVSIYIQEYAAAHYLGEIWADKKVHSFRVIKE